MTFAIKFYSSNIAKSTHDRNVKTSSFQNSFTTKFGGVNTDVKADYDAHQKNLAESPIKGTLRIHVEFPKPEGELHTPYREGEDVLVFITCDNMDEYFREDWKDPILNEQMKALKSIIRNGMVLQLFFSPQTLLIFFSQ